MVEANSETLHTQQPFTAAPLDDAISDYGTSTPHEALQNIDSGGNGKHLTS